MITVPPIGEDEREQTPVRVARARWWRIIKPRVEEILEMVRDRLAACAFATDPRGRVILTGGASQLTGIAGSRHAAFSAGRCVSDGRSASPDCPMPPRARRSRSRPGYWSIRRRRISNISNRGAGGNSMTGTGGYFARVGRWLRESF